jgi:xanthine dehydrogenase accessory factor
VFDDVRVLIKGAGDLATGVAVRLWRVGFRVVMTELERPIAIRRTVAFSEAVYDGKTTVEGLTARCVKNVAEAKAAWNQSVIPVIVDPNGESVATLQPEVVVDAIVAKRNLGTQMHDAPLVIGLGPGFTAGRDVHAVVETNRGHYLGRVLWTGSAQANTCVPGRVNGIGAERVIYAPIEGTFMHRQVIGAALNVGDVIGLIDQTPVAAPIRGVLRGLIHDGVCVNTRMKIGDVDPRRVVDHCWSISDKALALAGGVLEAILVHLQAIAARATAGGEVGSSEFCRH